MAKAKKTDKKQSAKPEVIDQEDYMNDVQKEHFRNILLKWKEEIEHGSARTLSYLRDEKTTTSDLNDRATQEEEFSLELRTRDRERKLLKKIDRALYRISNDEFGWCEKCGTEIGIKRLEARPTAELCIDCKEIEERKEKNFNDIKIE